MKKLTVIGSLVVILTIVAGALIYSTRRVSVIVSVADVERGIREHLSIGASRSQVESYLDERRIRHSYTDHSAAGTESTRIESALIPDSSRTWLVRGDIQIVFKFDEQDKLTQYSVKEIFTGP
jgi:hypothetical protein